MTDQIKLINHSSIFIENDNKNTLLTDPWYTGSAFNDGWSLFYENEKNNIIDVLKKTEFIFLSHEHPDHFSIKFFKDYGDLIKERKIKIIFQNSQDQRVESFLKKKGFEMIILEDKKKYDFNNETNITIFKQGHIDSAFLYETKDFYHLNINDCNFLRSELLEIKNYIKNKNKKIFIYVQFSYASFRADDEWLKKAADYKLDNIVRISKIFNSSLIIPFASFFYFSHSENQHLTKFVYNCSQVSSFLDNNKVNHCFLNPEINLVNLNQLTEDIMQKKQINSGSLKFWDNMKSKAVVKFYEKKPEHINIENIKSFLARIKKFNNLFLLFLIRYLTFKKIFGDLFIKINITNDIYLLNFYEVKKINNYKKKADICISSEQFNLLLSQPYGVESLLVSGRLKTDNKNGLRNLTSSIGITTINLSNYGINFKDIFNKLIFNKIIGLIHRAISQKS